MCSFPDVGLASLGAIETQADVIAMLPSKMSSLERSRSTIERAHPTSIKRRDNKSVKSIHPPAAAAASEASMAPHSSESIELDIVDLNAMSDEEEVGEDFIDEGENWRRLQEIKSMTSSLDIKRKAR